MEEKNWLKDLVNSSDFEYFDDEDYEEYEGDEDLEDDEYAIGRSRGKGKAKRTTAGRVLTTKRTTAGRVPSGEQKNVPLQASPNPFNNPESYNNISNLNFDLIVEASTAATGATPIIEVPILYPYMTYQQQYETWLSRYGIVLNGSVVSLNLTPTPHCSVTNSTGTFALKTTGMSFNMTDLYNAILHRGLKLQINKIRFALQEENDVAYLDALTMYSIGITSKIQKDSLNTGSFVKPDNFNKGIVDIDMKIVLDYNSVLTYMYNPNMISRDAATGVGSNTFRMSFFCNILK